MRTLLTGLLLLFLITSASAVTVYVSSPTSSSTVSTSFTLQASASSSNKVTGWAIYVDGATRFSTPGPTSSISVPLSVGTGSHSVVVRAWDSAGASGSSNLTVNATSSVQSTTRTTVTVNSPSGGASVSNPVTFSASASSPNGIAGWVIYMDGGQKIYQADNYSSSLKASVNLPSGSHGIYIRAWDRSNGGYGTSNTFSVNVGGTSSGGGSNGLPTPPSSATVIGHIENMSGFKTCSANCAGGQSTSNYWMAQFQTSPSTDGSSMQFFNGGNAWANVLWYKGLGPHNSASHFLWDFYVYFDSTSIANLHTAEYDLYQSINGFELMIGSQCNFGNNRWDTWNQAAGRWIGTSIPCPRFSPNSWHRIQWYMQRVSSTQYKYVTLVVDGKPYSVNQTYSGSYAGWADVVGVQWQLDLGGNGVDAHEWVDNVKLTMW
jgi:hypothetical protein